MFKEEVLKLIDDRLVKGLNNKIFELDKYEDDYRLPKMFISAMGEIIRYQFQPLLEEEIKERNKIMLQL